MRALDLLKARIASLETLKQTPTWSGGVTPGGLVHDPVDHAPWYAKRHSITASDMKFPNPEHTYSEHLSNQIYRHVLGHDAAPHSVILHDDENQPVYLSKVIAHYKSLNEYGTMNEHGDVRPPRNMWEPHHPDVAKHFLKGAAADFLVGNSDLTSDNVGLVKHQTPVRIDNGSNFMHHAWGARKDEPGHVSYFVDDAHHHALERLGIFPGKSASHKAARAQTLAQREVLRPQVSQILKTREQEGGWGQFIEKHIPTAPASFKAEAHKALNLRTAELARRAGLV